MHFFNKLLVTIFVCISGSLCSMQPQEWVFAYNSDYKEIICWPEDCKECLEEVVKLPGLQSRSELKGVLIQFQETIKEKNPFIIHESLLKEEKEYMVIEGINKNILIDSERKDFYRNRKIESNKVIAKISLSCLILGYCFSVLHFLWDDPRLVLPAYCLYGLGFLGFLYYLNKNSLNVDLPITDFVEYETQLRKNYFASSSNVFGDDACLRKLLHDEHFFNDHFFHFCYIKKSIEILATKKDYSLQKAKKIALDTYVKLFNNNEQEGIRQDYLNEINQYMFYDEENKKGNKNSFICMYET